MNNWLDNFKRNLLEVLYRADQPRDERGRWVSTGGGASFVRDALRSGGFSYQPIGKMSPTSGCMVSLHSRFGGEYIVELPEGAAVDSEEVREVVQAELNKYIQKHVQLFKETPNLYAGGWVEEGKFCFDVSENLPADDMRNVVMTAMQRDQRGVYNVETGDYILEEDYHKFL